MLGIDPTQPRHGPPDRGRRADLAVARAAEPLRDPRDDAAHRLFSGWLIFAVALLLTVAMLHGAPALELGRLFAFVDNGGAAGGGVWPAARGLGTMTLLALMWPIYTITGFDASAHTSEETVQAAAQRPEGHPPLGLRVGPGRLGDGGVVRARDARRRRGRAPGRRRVLLADGAGAAGRRRARAVGRHRARELPVRPRLHDVDLAHDVRVRARRRAARIGRAQAGVAALAHAGARDLDDRGARARVDAVRARVLDADDRVRDLPLPVVRDADAGRAARVRTDLDQVRSVSPRRAALQVARRRLGAGRGAARLDRRAAPEREGADGRAARWRPCCSPPGGWASAAASAARPSRRSADRPAQHGARTSGAGRYQIPRGGIRSARRGPGPPEPRAPTRARRSPAACA